MVKRIIQSGSFPIIIFVLLGFFIGISLFQDFGASWDEPDLYTYANQSFQAYSIQNRLDDQYNLESLLGPDNLRLYGPAYLLIGKLFVGSIKQVFPALLEIDIWHLINFFMFLFGVVIFYKLLLRWIKPLAAFITTLLFASQPVLFGLSWIDPKDVPFMVLFTATIYFGLRFSDFLVPLLDYPVDEQRTANTRFVTGKKNIRLSITIFIILFTITLCVYSFSKEITQFLYQTVLNMNLLSSENLFRRLFYVVAKNASSTPLNLYADKIANLFLFYKTVLAVLTGAYGLFTLSLVVFPKWIQGLYFFIKDYSFNLSNGLRQTKGNDKAIGFFLVASFFLGITISTRVLGPLAGLLVAGVLLLKFKWKALPILLTYGLLSIIVAFSTWPYLWQNTFQRFFDVFLHMSDNPVGVGVLFQGQVFDSRNLPVTYLPNLLGITLTIPAILLAIGGFVMQLQKIVKRKTLSEDFVLVAWFLIPFMYVLLFRPPMYDNYRHFIFILPPLFYFCGVMLQEIFKIYWIALRGAVMFVVLFPGLPGNVEIHPYEYSYYNQFVGGLSSATGNYEVDYWLTCYKELTLEVNAKEKTTNNLFVAFMPNLVKYYADSRFSIYKANDPNYPVDSLLILPLRRESSKQFPEYPVEYLVKRENVPLCVAKRVK